MKIAIIGAGSRFTLNMIQTMDHELFQGCQVHLMDVDEANLKRAREAVAASAKEGPIGLCFTSTTSLEEALDGANYVIVCAEQNRFHNWLRDIEIPRKYGVNQVKGENGGPGGLIHGIRNIAMFTSLAAEMERLCPDAWLLNYTNPMSIVCEWLDKHSKIKYAGLCHQVHGSFGLIAEQLGLEPGDLRVTSVGINHLNWLFDIQYQGKSWMSEFFARIEASPWWKEHSLKLPRQDFSLQIYKIFGMYPIGYDDHIAEYFSCFYEPEEWNSLQIASTAETRLKPHLARNGQAKFEAQNLLGNGSAESTRFPKDVTHPHYREIACQVITALETGEPTYFDAMVGRNNGAVSNLPERCVVDRPVVVAGGEIRSVHVGALPPGPLEVCRRQVALHEMIVNAAVNGDEGLALQALCLDPHIRSITQARAIWNDFHNEYEKVLPPGFQRVGC